MTRPTVKALSREPADTAPPELDPPRLIKIGEVEYEVAPHGHGRYKCPYCHKGRPVFIYFFATSGIGKFVPLSIDGKATRGALQRDCSRCGATWYVETLDPGF